MIIEALLLLPVLSVVGFLIFILCYQTFSRKFTIIRHVPGPKGFPIIGNIHNSFGKHEELFKKDREFAKKYYPIYKEWVLTYAALNLYQPEDIELVLASNKHINKSGAYTLLQIWLGTGLLTSGGTKWQTRRKILTPSFHFNILQDFLPMLNEESKKLIDELNKHPNGCVINLVDPITQFTLLSIAETAMGVKLDTQAESCNDYKQAIYNFGSSVIYRLLRPWLITDTIFFNFTKLGHEIQKSIKHLHDFSRNVIEERKQNFSQQEPGKRLALLDLLLSAKRNGADIDDEGIAEEVDTFMFEGHDTTTVSICYTLLLLANNPSIQKQLYEELREVLGDPRKPPTFSELKSLSLMERCVKESLRLFPSVPFISRTLEHDITTHSGYVLPKGAEVHIHIYDLHHNSEIYPDPEKFDPDRFLPENTKKRHPFAYLPFSAGPRNCIGQKFAMLEVKTVLCAILGNFVLEAEDKPSDIEMMTDLVLRNKQGVKIKLNKINH